MAVSLSGGLFFVVKYKCERSIKGVLKETVQEAKKGDGWRWESIQGDVRR